MGLCRVPARPTAFLPPLALSSSPSPSLQSLCAPRDVPGPPKTTPLPPQMPHGQSTSSQLSESSLISPFPANLLSHTIRRQQVHWVLTAPRLSAEETKQQQLGQAMGFMVQPSQRASTPVGRSKGRRGVPQWPQVSVLDPSGTGLCRRLQRWLQQEGSSLPACIRCPHHHSRPQQGQPRAIHGDSSSPLRGESREDEQR